MSDQTRQAVIDALQTHLNDSNQDGENRVVTDFIVTLAFINLDRPGGITGHFHEVEGAMHSLMGLTQIQDMWLTDCYAAREDNSDEETSGY